MWWFLKYFALVFTSMWIANCNPVINDLNTSIRNYLVTDEHDHVDNSTNVKTLQKEPMARYAYSAPERKPIVFKEIPDNALSASAHSRGIHHDHDHGAGYTLHDFADHDGHGHGYGFDHDHFGHDYHGGHYGHGHSLGYGYGHHHKHYDHGLAAKSLLLPIAGLAFLGAAAALVSNPILLQLGVISGRKRRDTESSTFNVNLESWSRDDDDSKTSEGTKIQDKKKPKDETQIKELNQSKNETVTVDTDAENLSGRLTQSNSERNIDILRTVKKDKATSNSGEDKQQNISHKNYGKSISAKKVQQKYKLKKSTSPAEEVAAESPTETVTAEIPRSTDKDSDKLVRVPLKIRG